MNINGISGTGAIQPGTSGMGTGGQTDPVSRDLQNQIEKLRNDLKEVSADQNMPTEAKMKKRQEIQKQISELEIQLRQHQMEVKKEERQKKKEESSFDELAGTKPQEKQQNGKQNTGMSTGSMEAMISADTAVKQANTNGSVAKKMEGRANVLEVEISLDSSRGGNTNLKEAELAKTKEAAEKATASQMDSLAQASETLQNASKTESNDNKNDDNKKKADHEDQEGKGNETANPSDNNLSEEDDFVYHPVDVRL